MTNYKALTGGIIFAVAFFLQGCYTTPPPVQVAPKRSVTERFEASWQAARGAASDLGVRITKEDRSTGTLRGDKGSSNVAISVVPQADQTIQVGFSVTGGDSYQDGILKDHLTRAYQTRMGR
jgi:hypothetical protein